mmetsp:Transcript_27608/g.48783  ORF Transcript_27608/g.48783 Transcript_27608/m.48783 type:complete len:229 (+) Transcript_27608:272-958(+)
MACKYRLSLLVNDYEKWTIDFKMPLFLPLHISIHRRFHSLWDKFQLTSLYNSRYMRIRAFRALSNIERCIVFLKYILDSIFLTQNVLQVARPLYLSHRQRKFSDVFPFPHIVMHAPNHGLQQRSRSRLGIICRIFIIIFLRFIELTPASFSSRILVLLPLLSFQENCFERGGVIQIVPERRWLHTSVSSVFESVVVLDVFGDGFQPFFEPWDSDKGLEPVRRKVHIDD